MFVNSKKKSDIFGKKFLGLALGLKNLRKEIQRLAYGFGFFVTSTSDLLPDCWPRLCMDSTGNLQKQGMFASPP
jgi:hypothetical protein